MHDRPPCSQLLQMEVPFQEASSWLIPGGRSVTVFEEPAAPSGYA
jgi:hypothetical protein